MTSSQFDQSTSRSLALRVVSLSWLAVLLFIWAVPHTTAARHILLIGGFLWMAWLFRKNLRDVLADPAVRRPMLWLAAISIWLVLQALTIAAFPERTWGELKSQWLVALIAMTTGVLVGQCEKSGRAGFNEGSVVAVIAGVMILQVALTTLDALVYWWQMGELPLMRARLTGTKSSASFINNMLLAVLCADLLARLNGVKPLLPIGRIGFPCVLALSLFATYQLGARNGVVGVVFLTFSTLALWLVANRKRLPIAALSLTLVAVIAVVAGLVWLNIATDPRWQTFSETVPIALDTEKYHAWMDTHSQLPVMANGQPVDHSAYMRIAWAKEGLKLAAEHPWGLGYDRDAFRAGLMLKFGMPGGGSSHSGWLDWAIATGIPGTLLLLTFFGSLVLAGSRAYLRERSPVGLLLVFLVSGFAGRMILDGVNRDHSLQQFMFLAGALLPLLSRGVAAGSVDVIAPAGRECELKPAE